jgi:hypothetical protein
MHTDSKERIASIPILMTQLSAKARQIRLEGL